MTDQSTTHFELSAGAILILSSSLGRNGWYKDDPKPDVLCGRGFSAHEALPEFTDMPTPGKDETKEAFEERFDKWAEKIYQFEWTPKQKDAARACLRYFFKQGIYSSTKYTIEAMRFLGLGKDEE